jgi:hypothetical protein
VVVEARLCGAGELETGIQIRPCNLFVSKKESKTGHEMKFYNEGRLPDASLSLVNSIRYSPVNDKCSYFLSLLSLTVMLGAGDDLGPAAFVCFDWPQCAGFVVA